MSNSNSCQNDDMCVDSTSDVNSKKTGRNGVKKVPNKKSKNCADEEKIEAEEKCVNEVMEVDGNDVQSEKKNGVAYQVSEEDENGNDSTKLINKASHSAIRESCDGNETESVNKNTENCEDLELCNSSVSNKQTSDVEDSSFKNSNSENNLNELDKGIDIPPDSATGNGEVPMEVDSSNSEGSLKKQVKEDAETSKSIRPADKMLGMSPEVIVSDIGPAENLAGKSEPSPSRAISAAESSSEGTSKAEDVTKAEPKKAEAQSSEEKEEVKPESTKKETSKAESSSKKEGESSKKKKNKICEECGKKGLKFQVFFQGKTRFFCSDKCITSFKTTMGKPTPEAPSSTTQLPMEKCAVCSKDILDKGIGTGYYPAIGEVKGLCTSECLKKYHDSNEPPKNCAHCGKTVVVVCNADLLRWETMVFCNQDCLGNYQTALGGICTCCQSPVDQPSLGKYCVCFGSDIRQFCSGKCLEDYKKGLKVCTFCQTDLSSGVDSFVAPVGERSQFKDFCSQLCMERYENINSISKNARPVEECVICKKTGMFKIQLGHEHKLHPLCSDICVSGFRYLHKIKDYMCDSCFKFFIANSKEEFSLNFEGQHKQFCSKGCMTLFTLSHRKIVPCVYCKVKKYNFDMIRSNDATHFQPLVFCSVNCLTAYRAKLEEESNFTRCQNCGQNLPVAYNVTSADGTKSRFCSYNCVVLFQNKFLNTQPLASISAARQGAISVSKTTSATTTPVISNVVSLAPTTQLAAPGLSGKSVPPRLIAPRQPSPIVIAPKSQSSSTIMSSSISSAASSPNVYREVIVKPPPPKSLKNKTVSVKPVMQSKGITCKPHPCHKAVQTDPRPILIPIPVPVYVPTPVHLYTRPVPCPLPFPVPIPIPIVLPTSAETHAQVLKHLKEIQDKLPPNLYGAELLVMAEMVAESENKTQTESVATELKSDAKKKEESILVESTTQTPNSFIAEPQKANANTQTVNFDSEPEDESVSKDSKKHRHHHHHHHHHKRKAESHDKSRGHKKYKIEEVPAEEIQPQVTVPNDAPSVSFQTDPPEAVTRLKVL